MAKSLLKTRLSETLGVTRSSIEFIEDKEEVEIKIKDTTLISFETVIDDFCCGVVQLGNTRYEEDFLENSQDEELSIVVDCMKQILIMITRQHPERGIITYSQVINHYISQALKSDQTDNNPWKLVSEFYNPNSGNTVCYFIAKLTDR